MLWFEDEGAQDEQVQSSLRELYTVRWHLTIASLSLLLRQERYQYFCRSTRGKRILAGERRLVERQSRRSLFVAQCCQWVKARSAPRGYEAGSETNAGKQNGRCNQRQ